LAKAMVLNLDAMMAVLIASMFIATISISQAPLQTGGSLEILALDISAVLDKSGVLQSLNNTTIATKISESLPQDTNAAMNISCFTYNTSYNASHQNSSEFILNQSITIQPIKSGVSGIKIAAPRYFPVLGATAVTKYCLSRLEVWRI